ncbi:MAG: B12-binding domain-containing radical SAM protein [Candidatus Brocadia sp.]|nr:B12-binding domain-containing radical SAM protein [Candidatus Brocadia sp.]
MLKNKSLKISKVVLLNLPEEGQCADYYTPDYAIEEFSVYPPLGLLYVATEAKKFYPVEVLDVVALRYGIKETVNHVERLHPDVIGISCTTFRIFPMSEIIRQVKMKLPETIFVVGGPHTSLYPVETLNLPGVDFVIKGEGDRSFKTLLDVLSLGNSEGLYNIPGLVFREGERVVQNREDVVSVENLPFPDRRLLNWDYYHTAADKAEQVVTMISSRGCPFQCTFCDVMIKNYRSRPAIDVVNEMEHIVSEYDNPVIQVFDDTFNIDRKRVLDICEGIRQRKLNLKWTTRARANPFDEEMVVKMKEAGLKRVHFGVESGSETTLKKINKSISKEHVVNAFQLCRKYQIDTLAYFIIGFEWETKEDIQDTIRFIKEIKPTFIMANTLYPAAKTKIYEELIKHGKIKEDFWQKFASNPVRNFNLPQWQSLKTRKYLKRKLDEIYLRFYLSPDFVSNNLKSDVSESFSLSHFFYKVKLAIIIVKSYVVSLVEEFMTLRR